MSDLSAIGNLQEVIKKLRKERDQWKQRAEAAELELQRHKAKPCDDDYDCGQCAECALLACETEVQRQSERAEAAEKACAEMREALTDCSQFPLGENLHYKVCNALDLTSGTGYLPPAVVKELVQPLVEALETYKQWNSIAATRALAYAKEKGWL